MTDNPTTDPRATPLGRAVTALEDRIRRSVIVELRPGMIGQPFAATMPELARDALSAALDAVELGQVVHEHRPHYLRSGRGSCCCDWTFEPAWDGTRSSERRTAARKAFAAHQGAAIRATILGVDQ